MSNTNNTLLPDKLQTRTRRRAVLSCTECRRKKQKCNQAKDRPCNNCARRYPPVDCVYDAASSRLTDVNDEQHGTNLVILRSDQLFFSKSLSNSGRSATTRNSTSAKKSTQPNFRPVFDISSIFKIDIYQPVESSNAVTQNHGISTISTPLGCSAHDTALWLPIESTYRNTELLHFFIQRLSPYTSSLDGKDPPLVFTAQWMRFLVQSPLVVYISILSAAYFQATARGLNVEKNPDAISARIRLINLINEHIKEATTNQEGVVSEEAVAAVMSLSYNELIYADNKSVLVHMSGLQSMITSQGGLDNIKSPMLRILLARTDYQISSTFEMEPFLHASRSIPLNPLTIHPPELNSPFLLSSQSFIISPYFQHEIFIESANILDSIKAIINLILTHPTTSINEIITKSTSLHSHLLTKHATASTRSQSSSPSLKHLIHQTITTATLFLLNAIISRTPLSKSSDALLFAQLNATLWYVPLSVWKRISGIFLYVLLIVNPYARDRREGRFVKGLIAAAFVGVEVKGREGGWERESEMDDDNGKRGKGEERSEEDEREPGVASHILRGVLGLQAWLDGKEDGN